LTATAEQVERRLERGMRMLHIEHPDRPGEAWCGAEVIGVRGHFGKVDCIVCADLRAVRRAERHL